MLECPASSANTRTLTPTLVNNGATLYKVQKLLGHSRSATTERYAHLANHRLQQAVSFGLLIDEYLSSGNAAGLSLNIEHHRCQQPDTPFCPHARCVETTNRSDHRAKVLVFQHR